MKKRIEVIARGVCVKDGRLLLCHGKGAGNTYLPGGHVEFGESAGAALVREIKEELGVKSTLGRFLGVVEHEYSRKDGRFCEINLVFEVKIPTLKPARNPRSEEDYIEFYWCDIKKLTSSKLEPHPLQRCLSAWLANKPCQCWKTTI